MPIFYNRIADQIEDLLPDFYQEDGPRFITFLKAYFEFLEKGQLVYKDGADVDYIGLEDGTVAGEEFNADGQRGNMLQEPGTYAPSSITDAKINYEIDIDTQGVQKTSFELNEYVVGSSSGAIARIDVIGATSNLHIEQFSEAQFDIDETITGMTSGMTAKVSQFIASPLHAVNNLLSYADIDKTSGDFLEYFRRDFMPFIDRDVLANKRLLQKHIQDLYLSKGTKGSYEFLFRILYGLEAEITFPTENVIRPSESEFVEPTVMRLYSTKDLSPYKGGFVKKTSQNVITAKAYINDIYGMSGTNDGLDAYEAELIVPFIGAFSAGDSVTLVERDGLRIDITATVRGIMTDIDSTESSVYVGLEDKKAAILEDGLRLENPENINIVGETGTGEGAILDSDGNNLVLEYAIGSDRFEITFIELEDGTQTGVASSGKILIDALSVDSNGNASGGAVYDADGVLTEDNAFCLEQPAGYPHITDAPDTRTTAAGTFHMGGGLYQEQASLGALYSESDTFNYQTAKGGTASQSINVIGSIGRGGVTDIVIDGAGSSYISGDKLVFVNAGTDGMHAEGEIEATTALVELERGTPLIHNETQNVFTFTGNGSNKVFSGVSNEGIQLGYDPGKVEVFVGGTELTRETQFTSDQSGQQITIAAGTSAPGNGVIVEVHKEFQGILLENALRPSQIVFNLITGLPEKDPVTGEVITKEVKSYISAESAGAIRKIKLTNEGLNYKSTPEVYIGGYIYYDEMTTGTTFSVGEVVTSTNLVTMKVLSHNTVKKRVTVYKRPTDPVNTPTGTITGGISLSVATILQTNVTQGNGAELWSWGDRIGSVQKLKMQDVGHDFEEGGIGNYKQNAIVKSIGPADNETLATETTVTASLTGTSGTVHTFDGDKNIVALKNVKGIFNDGDYCTTSDNKNFIIGKISPCTARGKLGGTALLDGNYTNDTGFPSVDSQRIHDGEVYQDFSYIIKVGRSINDYRAIIKSLLSPAGTIFFGEVAIRNTVDARAAIYNVNFDGTTTTRAFVPTLIIGSRQDTADIALEDGTLPSCVLELELNGSVGSGAVAGVYTFEPVASGHINTGLKITLQATSSTAYINLQIINRGRDYDVGDVVNVTREQVGGSGSTTFVSFKVKRVGSPLVTSSNLTFTSGANPIGKVELETGEGIMTTERFLSIDTADAPLGLDTQDPPQLTIPLVFKDQASGIYYSNVPGYPAGAQSYIVGQTFTPATRDFFNRQLIAELSPKGHRVHKELDIFPTYNQHKIYYSTLSNALAVGTKVRGATSGALGIVIQHDTTNKFIIVHRDSKDWGKAGSQFSGTEIIQNITSEGLSTTNYFTATDIELHWTPEDIVTKREPAAITADTTLLASNQKTNTEGGGEAYAHADYISGYQGRGKVLVAGDHNETYDSEMRQRKVTIISSPIYSSSTTQRGRLLSAGNHTKTPLNQRGARTEGTNTIVVGDTAPPYLAISGTALRLDDIKNSVSEAAGDSSATVRVTTDGVSRTGVNLSSGVNWGYRPAGQKLYESTNFLSEKLISEASDTFVMEDTHGNIMGEYFGQGGIVLFEDDTEMLCETATIVDETEYFVSEETTQVTSYNLSSESGERLVHESGNAAVNSGGVNIESGLGGRFLIEEALMIGQKESNQSGPTIGDLRNIMFSENYSIMKKIQQEGNTDDIRLESGNAAVNSGGVNTESGLGGHMIQEAPSEGLRISDISTIYSNRLIINLERELGRKTNFNHSAVVQTG